jgi:hypothetical protein
MTNEPTEEEKKQGKDSLLIWLVFLFTVTCILLDQLVFLIMYPVSVFIILWVCLGLDGIYELARRDSDE